MRVLAIQQPWATLAVTPSHADPTVPIKHYETRKWETKVRGTVAIQASVRWEKAQRDLVELWPFPDLLSRYGLPAAADLPRGAIVGVVDVIEVLPTSNGGWTKFHPWRERLSYEQLAIGDYSFGRFGWKLANPVPLPERIPFKGQLGMRILPDPIFAEIARQLGWETL